MKYEKLSESRLGESSATVRARVEVARQRQRERFSNTGSSNPVMCNADMRPEEVRKFYVLDETGRNLMQTAMNQLQLSARAYHRVLKLARTIADLDASESVSAKHLAEAVQYRSLDRDYWT